MTETKKKKFRTLDLVYVGLFAGLIAVCAWISIPLTVSITLQTFGICLCAGLLGFKRATASVIVYILLGMIGVPVFTGFKAGFGVLFGPTGGYIIGFIFTAIIVGLASDKIGKKLWQNALFMTLGVLTCYLFGTIWFVISYKVSFVSALSTCVIPFLIPDAVKIALACVLVNRLHKFVK